MKILTFGIIREIVGKNILEISNEVNTVSELEAYLKDRFPKLENLNSFIIAVDHEYSLEDRKLDGSEEIALIPPVSGG